MPLINSFAHQSTHFFLCPSLEFQTSSKDMSSPCLQFIYGFIRVGNFISFFLTHFNEAKIFNEIPLFSKFSDHKEILLILQILLDTVSLVINSEFHFVHKSVRRKNLLPSFPALFFGKIWGYGEKV